MSPSTPESPVIQILKYFQQAGHISIRDARWVWEDFLEIELLFIRAIVDTDLLPRNAVIMKYPSLRLMVYL